MSFRKLWTGLDSDTKLKVPKYAKTSSGVGEIVHAIARGLASWFGAETLVDDIAGLIRGYNSDDLELLATANQAKINSLLKKLQAKYDLDMEEVDNRMSSMPLGISSNVISAIQQEKAKLRERAEEIRDQFDTEVQKLENETTKTEMYRANPVKARKQAHHLQESIGTVSGIERRLNQNAKK